VKTDLAELANLHKKQQFSIAHSNCNTQETMLQKVYSIKIELFQQE
jgi:hypothetical protein